MRQGQHGHGQSIDGEQRQSHGEDARAPQHEHPRGWRGLAGRLAHAVPILHSHHEQPIDAVLATHERGIRATKLSLAGLGVTALLQLVIVAFTGSVALLADTVHNFSDALTAIPLWIAFAFGRRVATRRYTYGYGRLEDLAGGAIVLMILASAGLIAYESIDRLLDPQPIERLWLVVVAALIGALGNEAVAVLRIRAGRQIGSAALVADGQHARADALTSLAVLLGAAGVAAGFPLADPVIGLLIAAAILLIAYGAGLEVWRRLTDAVDPVLLDTLSAAVREIEGVEDVGRVRARWLGHQLHTELDVVVDEELSTRESHEVAEAVRDHLLHARPEIASVQVHVDPCGHSGGDPHRRASHQRMHPAA